MSCKYCHLSTHSIDKCPTIICKNCKDVGHPQWLCKNKNKNNVSHNTTINMSKKYTFPDEIKKKGPYANALGASISTTNSPPSNVSNGTSNGTPTGTPTGGGGGGGGGGSITSAKVIEQPLQKTLNYYSKLDGKQWGDI